MKKFTFLALFLGCLLWVGNVSAQTGSGTNPTGGLGGNSPNPSQNGGNNSHLLLEDDGRCAIYPNPSPDGKFTVEMSYAADRVEVYNTVGQSVNASITFRNGSNNRTAMVDLTGNNPGIYFVRVHGQGRTEVQRVVVR